MVQYILHSAGWVKRLQYAYVCLCVSSHRVEIVEEAHAVRRRGGLHGELQEGLHVQVGLDHCGRPQECRHCCPGPVYASYTEKKKDIHQYSRQ